jgi:hypothetical protein
VEASRFWTLVAALTALIGLLVWAPWSGSGPPLSPIAEAAEQTARMEGFQLTFTGTVESRQAGAYVTVSGDGEYNADQRRVALNATFRGSGFRPIGSTLIADEGGFYTQESSEGLILRLGNRFLSGVPGFDLPMPAGKAWLRVSANGLPEKARNPDGDVDPGLAVSELRSVAVFQPLADQQVDGVLTSHYEVTIDLDRSLQQLRDEGRPEEAADLQTLMDLHPDQKVIPAQVWIDGDNRLRRLTTRPTPIYPVAQQLDVTSYNVVPPIELPPAAGVYDGTKVVSDAFDAAEERATTVPPGAYPPEDSTAEGMTPEWRAFADRVDRICAITFNQARVEEARTRASAQAKGWARTRLWSALDDIDASQEQAIVKDTGALGSAPRAGDIFGQWRGYVAQKAKLYEAAGAAAAQGRFEEENRLLDRIGQIKDSVQDPVGQRFGLRICTSN